jgi:inorganic triphosphatase YgiF
MTDQDREIELKLELDLGGRDRLRAHPAFGDAPVEIERLHSIYYDTAEGALRKAGFTLRVRRAGERFVQTIKQDPGEAAGLFDRPEWEIDVNGPEPDLERAAETPLGKHLSKKIRRKLQPLVRSEMCRTTWRLDHDGSAMEVTLDEGEVGGGEADQTIVELEFELKRGAPQALLDFAAGLADQVPLRLGVLTKAERGWALADGSLRRPLKAARVKLDPGMNAAEGFAAIVSACLKQYRWNEDLVIATQDPAALHQARVAMRRLRSAFTLFRPVIVDERFPELREDVRWFTDQLGYARNLDVLLKRTGDRSEALRTLLEAERERAYAQVLEALGSARLRRLMLDLVGWLESGPWRETKPARAPLDDFASAQLDKRWRKVKRPGRDLAELDPEARHRLRIEIKKLRYAIEFLAALQTGEAAQRQKQFAAGLEEMQEQLGELNDVETARDLLAGLLEGRADRDALIAAATGDAPQASEQQAITAAEHAFADLVETGRFWR